MNEKRKKIDPRSKKLFWIKLDRHFFKRHDVKIVEAMENGEKYVLFYMKLLLESLTHEGYLRFNDLIPYDEKMLSVVTNTDIDVVRSAMHILSSLHLMEVLDDKTIYMNEMHKMIGYETIDAARKREERAKKEVGGTLSQNVPNISISKSLSNSKYKSNSLSKEKTYIDSDNNIGKSKSIYTKTYFENKEVNDIFLNFLELRKSLKAKNTEQAIKLLLNKLEPLNDKEKIIVIENSIMNSWKSVFPKEEKELKKVEDRW